MIMFIIRNLFQLKKKISLNPQTDSQELINKVFETKGSNKKMLLDAVRDYSGDVENVGVEDV